jgi:hypothetical protein
MNLAKILIGSNLFPLLIQISFISQLKIFRQSKKKRYFMPYLFSPEACENQSEG